LIILFRFKIFFAIARGFFPIQELCGTLTVLAIVKAEIMKEESNRSGQPLAAEGTDGNSDNSNIGIL
jgi:hypothetical protein